MFEFLAGLLDTQADVAGDVEEQLFRFSRILDGQPGLASLLGDYSAPAEGREKLLAQRMEEISRIKAAKRK